MADAVNQGAQATKWRDTATLMTSAWNKYFIVTGTGLPPHVPDVLWYNASNPSSSTTQGYSQAGQTIAVYIDLLTPDQSLQDLNYSYPDPNGSPPADIPRWNNPTYSYRALTALSHVNLSTRAVNHLKERFAQYLPKSLSDENITPLSLQGPLGGPLPEYWQSRVDNNVQPGQNNGAQPADATGSHGWASVPLVWLQQSLLGVRTVPPKEGQMREVHVRPDSGGLPYVAGNVMVYGKKLRIEWRPSAIQGKLTITVPEDLHVKISQPVECGSRLLKRKDKSSIDLSVETSGIHEFICE